MVNFTIMKRPLLTSKIQYHVKNRKIFFFFFFYRVEVGFRRKMVPQAGRKRKKEEKKFCFFFFFFFFTRNSPFSTKEIRNPEKKIFFLKKIFCEKNWNLNIWTSVMYHKNVKTYDQKICT